VLLTGWPLTFLGGKGGVGKTTTATALASRSARRGARTLLVSTDPAHSTADLLGIELGDEPREVALSFHAVEIDAERHADAYVDRIRRDAHRMVAPEVRDTVDRHLDLARRGAGTLEAATLDRLGDLIGRCPGEYDRIVIDTAPTGHTLRLLAMPELLTGWVQGLVRQREKVHGIDRMLRNLAGDDAPPEDPVIARLRQQRDRLVTLRRRLGQDAVVHLVLIPERLPIEETARAVRSLEEVHLPVGWLIVNRVLPDDAEGAYLAARRAQQQRYLDEIDQRFAGWPRLRVLQLERDVADAVSLAAIEAQLAPLDPPTSVGRTGSPASPERS
jgi:arsenite/tail-anchored protein-transporting ATPase